MSIVRQSVVQASILFLLAGAAAAQDTCTYKGADKGVWNSAANWTCGVVPANGGGFTYNAIIPVNITVNFDLPGYTELTGFNLSSGATLSLDGQQFKILGVAVQAGTLLATGAGTQYLAQSQFASFQTNASAFAKDGAQIAIAAPTYQWNDGGGPRALLRADGSGSVLDLSSLSSFTANMGGYYGGGNYTVAATDGGTVNLSNVTSIVGGQDNHWLHLRTESGGHLALTKLKSSTGLVFFDPETPTFTLPALQSVSSALIQVEPACSIDLPSVLQVDSTQVDIKDYGTLNAPKLTKLTNSFLSLNPLRSFNAPPQADINGTRIQVSDGAHLSVKATSYSWSNGAGPLDLFRADGDGSLLDLSSLTTFTANMGGYWGGGYYTVAATGGGKIDLSGVAAIVGGYDNHWLRFAPGSGGAIDLKSAKSSQGLVFFDPDVSKFELPELATASQATFHVGIFNSIKLPVLTSLTGGNLSIEDGGTIEAPKLTDFRSSFLALTQSSFLIAPPFEQIDEARIFVSGGRKYAVAATSYVWSNGAGPLDLFRADGMGSVLDLSSITNFSANIGGYWGGGSYTVAATNGGTIDLSGTASFVGGRDNHWLSIDALGGGSIILGDTHLVSGLTSVRADTVDSSIAALGDLVVDGGGYLSLTLVATMYLGGDFAFSTADESYINLADGKVMANGTAPQAIEVGGADLGQPIGSIPLNFQMGQLTVGSFDQKSKVILVDNLNNGNRGPNGEPELLYLQGFPADDGLRILNGSDLVLNGIDVYAVIGNSWVHLNELIPEGEASVAFDQGRIWLTDPGECFPDIDGGGTLDVFDFLGFVNLFNAGDLAADCDGNGSLDLFDFLCFVSGFNGGC